MSNGNGRYFGMSLGNLIIIVAMAVGFLLQTQRFEVHAEDRIEALSARVNELRDEVILLEDDVDDLSLLRSDVARIEAKLDALAASLSR